MQTADEAIETLKAIEEKFQEYFQANEAAFHAMHERMMDAAEANEYKPTNTDMFLHAVRLLDSLTKQHGDACLPWPTIIGLLAMRAKMPLLAQIEPDVLNVGIPKQETKH